MFIEHMPVQDRNDSTFILLLQDELNTTFPITIRMFWPKVSILKSGRENDKDKT